MSTIDQASCRQQKITGCTSAFRRAKFVVHVRRKIEKKICQRTYSVFRGWWHRWCGLVAACLIAVTLTVRRKINNKNRWGNITSQVGSSQEKFISIQEKISEKITFRCFWSAADTANTYSFVYSRSRFNLCTFGSNCINNVSSLNGTTTCVPSGNTTSTVLTCAKRMFRNTVRWEILWNEDACKTKWSFSANTKRQ